MARNKLGTALLIALGTLSLNGCAANDTEFISRDSAIEAALSEVNGKLLGIRFDEPDEQWDIFVQSGNDAYEIEVNAVNGKVVAVEQESLAEVQAELAGDLSHEGVEGDVD